MTEQNYPEHEKLKKIQDKSQAIGDFIEWLHNHKKIHFAKYMDVEYTDMYPFPNKEAKYTVTELHIQPLNIEEILAEFFHIDQNKLEAEKRQMLDYIRKLHAEGENKQ